MCLPAYVIFVNIFSVKLTILMPSTGKTILSIYNMTMLTCDLFLSICSLFILLNIKHNLSRMVLLYFHTLRLLCCMSTSLFCMLTLNKLFLFFLIRCLETRKLIKKNSKWRKIMIHYHYSVVK